MQRDGAGVGTAALITARPAMFRAALALLPALALAGCSSSPGAVVQPGSASAPYGSALTASPSSSSAEDLIGWPGAAGQVVRCAGPVVGTTSAAPYDGEDTAATPEGALAAARRWVRWSGAQQGFVLARREVARRLSVLEVDGVAEQALIVRRGPALKGDGTSDTVTRWWLESWARCDWSELPEAVAREQGLEIWSDADGQRQLTSTVLSFRYGSGCYPGMRVLDVGGPLDGAWSSKGRVPVEYVGHPAPELRDEWFDREFVEHVTVPPDAVDSGWGRDGEHLWFSADRGYAYVGTATDAQAWPRARSPIRCA